MFARCTLAWIALLGVATTALGQVMMPPPPPAEVGAATGGEPDVVSGFIYRLRGEAQFQEGCFPPCLCPIFFTEDLGGTLRITPMSSPTPGVSRWRIWEANWFYTWGEGSRRVVGSGVYTRTILPGAPPSHRIEMDLRVDDEAIEHFDSGVQPLAASSPTARPVFDLLISRAGMVCYDRVFRVAVEPVAHHDIEIYDISGTRYLEGCFPPCMCPIMFQVQMGGSFSLVPLGRAGGMDNYAVLDAQWWSMPASPLPVRASGYGIYRIGSPTMLPVIQQIMVADLNVNGVPGRFDSELLPAPALLPTIDIDISENGFFCYDRGFELLAHPAP